MSRRSFLCTFFGHNADGTHSGINQGNCVDKIDEF